LHSEKSGFASANARRQTNGGADSDPARLAQSVKDPTDHLTITDRLAAWHCIRFADCRSLAAAAMAPIARSSACTGCRSPPPLPIKGSTPNRRQNRVSRETLPSRPSA
jgi:hypothetical protein